MQWNDTTSDSIWSNALKDNVTSTLPNLSEAQPFKSTIASAPDTRGSLGIACLEDGDQRATGAVWGKLFQVEFNRFLEVGDGLFDSLTLADRANFRAVGNVQVAFFV
jgi:hypothetical protein